MKEDLEEGHFDADGNFIFDKVLTIFLQLFEWKHFKSKW